MPTTTRLPSLLAEAEQRAHDEHSRRLAELKALSGLLYQLDELRPELTAAGLTPYIDGMRLTWYRPSGSSLGARRKVLRIDTRGFTGDTLAQRWHAALLAQGLREISRSGSPYYPTAVLQRGYLLVEVDLPRQAAADQQQPQREAA